MPKGAKPRVSIGLPVYNGEAFIKDTIASILAQTFEDFELIILDNASTDRTGEICKNYAAKDRRVYYSRNETNLGASKNFNRVFELSSGEYFKWSSHDDMLAPEFLSKCVEVLDRERSAILCFSKIRIIDENGKVLNSNYSNNLKNISSLKPQDRFGELIRNRHGCYHVWGVMRYSALAKTQLLDSQVGSDRALLAELGLLGCFIDIPEDLFILRNHRGRSVKAYPFYLRRAWFDQSNEKKFMLPNWWLFREYFKYVKRVPLSHNTKMMCFRHLGCCLANPVNLTRLAMDLIVAIEPRFWKLDLKAKDWYHKRRKRLKGTNTR